MATSFAAYASQYLNRQQNQNNGESTMSSSQPMFFSFTTDDGSRGGHDTDLDDLDDPHLRGSESELRTPRIQEEDEDPYLRLDEDENVNRTGFVRGQQQTIPLIARSPSPDSPPGWLAHLTRSPRRSASPVHSVSSSSSDSSPPVHLLRASSRAPPPIPQTAHSLSLTDSLLPRDGLARPIDVFSLPDPRHTPRKRRKYHDSIWTSLWLGSVTLCIFFSILLLFLTGQPSNVPRSALPYTVFLHAVPLLTILTFLSAGAAYLHVYLLRIFVKPIMVATEVFVPATLFISAIWAFVGSFMWDGDQEPTWGETVGLRLFAIIPLALSLITARRLLHLPRQIHTASSTLSLTTHILITNPFLLALSPVVLLLMLISSLPFVTLIFRLSLIGYPTKVGGTTGRLEWHLNAWANWAIVGTLGIWLWSWAVARGIMRMTCASVVGAWYFADPSAPIPPPTSTHTIHAALVRSTGPSLGSVVLASVIQSLLQLLIILTIFLQKLPFYLRRIPWVPVAVPIAAYVIPGVSWVVSFLEGWTSKLNRYGLIYGGLTGEPFWVSAARAGVLVEKGREGFVSVEADGNPGRGRGRVLKRKKGFSSEPPLTLLTISPLTLTFPFALTTYLFVAHTLGAPNLALGAAVIAGTVTALVGLFCVGLVKDTADTMYLCYCIDKELGERRREEVFIAFEYDGSNATPSTNATATTTLTSTQQQGPTKYPSRNPEHIRPHSPLTSHNASIPQQRQRTVPLSPSYLQESSSGASASRIQQKVLQNHQVKVPMPVQETDELDPFRGSIVSDEEAALESPRRIQTHGREGSTGGGNKKQTKEVYIYPFVAGTGASDHRRLASAGTGISTGTKVAGEDRMMTSAEMNMKSQFLMNLRPFGEESTRSEDSQTTGVGASSRSRLEVDREGMLSEDEGAGEEDEEQLGPGSEFFR